MKFSIPAIVLSTFFVGSVAVNGNSLDQHSGQFQGVVADARLLQQQSVDHRTSQVKNVVSWVKEQSPQRPEVNIRIEEPSGTRRNGHQFKEIVVQEEHI